MGKYLIRYAIEKGAELVAAFDVNPAILGKDAAEIVGGYPDTGVKIADAGQADEILGALKPDVCIIATRSTVAELEQIFTVCAKHGVNAITTCEAGCACQAGQLHADRRRLLRPCLGHHGDQSGRLLL